MHNEDFFTPQRQSVTGVVLIFATSLYHILRSFWAVGIYLLVMDPDSQTLLFATLGIGILLVLILGYSILYYLKFIFYVDRERESFILEKGVISTDVVNIPFNKIQQVNFKRNILQRVIGVYSVVIDTAGSTDREVEIKALSKEKADILAGLLMRLSTESTAEETEVAGESIEEEVQEKQQVDWRHRLDVLTLLKLGLTSNYLRGLSVLLAFYFTLRSQFNYSEEFNAEIPYAAVTEVASTAVIILVLLLVGMIFTVAETFIKYYNLELTKTASGLQVEMGLRENTRVNLKDRRVQLLQEITNPIQQRLDLFQLKVSLASSRDDLGKDQIKIPGLNRTVVYRVKEYFYKRKIDTKVTILPHRILLFRKIMRRSFPVVIGVLILFVFTNEFPILWTSTAAFLLLILVSVFQYFHYRTIRLFVSEDFLVKRSGLWIRKKQYLEIFKLQSVSVSQPVWYKKRGLVSLTFHSAGGDIHYPLVREEEVLPLVDHIMYRIEATDRHWM